MKKNLFTIGLLATSLSVQAQNVLMHVDNTATLYISQNTLVYNGGGLQTKGTGKIENHGNVMIDGVAGNVYRNLDANGANVVNGAGGNFTNKLNQPDNYYAVNLNSPTAVPVYTYGQLYIQGLSQADVTGVVNQEFRQVSHGAYQQIALPFYDKPLSSLSAELGKNFNTTRGSGNEILYWNNPNVVFKNLPSSGLSSRIGSDPLLPPYNYYILGGTGLNLTQTRTLVGRPVVIAPTSLPVQMSSAGTLSAEVPIGSPTGFGVNGNNINEYNEKYNTYLQDTFTTSAWLGSFGKNIYQFGNPYLTNLDLSAIAFEDLIGVGDGNWLRNIYGVRLEAQGVQYSGTAGGGSSRIKFITYDSSGVLAGDVDYTMVRPMGTFVVKLKDNSPQTLNFSTLRRFKYNTRNSGTDYSVSAAKNSAGTVKQLGVIGLDASGNEVERTYYVVSPNAISGHTLTPTLQVTNSGNTTFGTFEEDAVNGGYDNNNVSYWLYINEAHDNNFKGKNIKLVSYNPNIVSFKFEVRENAVKLADGQHLLSSGEGFYYKKTGTSTINNAVHNAVVAAQPGSNAGVEYDLYYGAPNTAVLGTDEAIKKSRTLVVYNADSNGYFVRFDPSWKKADIQVYDMSGKLVISEKGVDAGKDFNLDLIENLKVSYLVSVTSEKGEKVNTKIVK